MIPKLRNKETVLTREEHIEIADDLRTIHKLVYKTLKKCQEKFTLDSRIVKILEKITYSGGILSLAICDLDDDFIKYNDTTEFKEVCSPYYNNYTIKNS